MCIKNNPAKFHPDPIWNDETLGFFEEHHPNEKNNKICSDMGSDPDLKIVFLSHKPHNQQNVPLISCQQVYVRIPPTEI